MGECGCVSDDDRYTFPGPGKSLYLLTLSGACIYCDAPPGITIELIEPDNILFKEYRRGEFSDGPLKLEKWADTRGVAITTGMRRHEFVAKLLQHLVGVDSRDMGENGKIDEASAEVILEEMFEDAKVSPSVVVPPERKDGE